MLGAIRSLVTRAAYIYRHEGLVRLLRRGVAFAWRQFYMHEDYYLYEHTIQKMREDDFLPEARAFTFEVISSNEEADRLANATGHDFRSCFVNARKSLDKGGVAFCFFINGEIAHIGWVALNKEAKDILNPLPYKVDFSSGEACTAGAETITKYRGKGLMTYGFLKRRRYLENMQITTSRNAIAVNNTPSQRVHAKFNPRIYAVARYIKILGWEFYKETPVTHTVSDEQRSIHQ